MYTMRIYANNNKWEINKTTDRQVEDPNENESNKKKKTFKVNREEAGREDDQQATSPSCYVTVYMSTCLFICDTNTLILL